MNLTDVPEFVMNGLHVFEMFRSLGFSASDIYFSASDPLIGPGPWRGFVQTQLVLRAQCREFRVDLGFLESTTQDATATTWKEFAEKSVEIGELPEYNDAFQRSDCWVGRIKFIAAMLEKGFVFPRSLN